MKRLIEFERIYAIIVASVEVVLMKKYTWEDYKKDTKERHPELKTDIEDIEKLVRLVGIIDERRKELGISQRKLANLCSIPQSTIARIERSVVSPNVDTLLKILRPLGLTIDIVPIQ